MSPFVTVGLWSACITAVGSVLSLLALSHLGTGFGFGDLEKDLLKIAVVSVLVGVAEPLMWSAPVQHWSFHIVVILVHAILLRLLFFNDLSSQEAFMVAVVTRVLYFLTGLVLKMLAHPRA